MDRVLEFAERVLGPCELQADCGWGHRMSSVLRLRDADGVVWFLKRHANLARYRAEVTAYLDWVPALHGAAPWLRASDDALQAVIVSAVPGEGARWPASQTGGPAADRRAEQHVQHRAGAVLRRMHDAQPPLPWPDFATDKAQEFEQLRPLTAPLLRPGELDRAGKEIAALAKVRAPERVPCHHDYTPRNWLVGNDELSVIDFEWSGLDARVADFARLHLGIWASRPDLRAVFLKGYGHDLGPADRQILHGCAVLTGVWLLVKARETRQPSFEDSTRASLLRLLDQAP